MGIISSFIPVCPDLKEGDSSGQPGGTCTLDDLLDIVELIRVRNENQTRAAEAART